MNNNNTNTLSAQGQQVLVYLEKGLSIIPISENGKTPLISWGKYQKIRPTKEELVAWWKKFPKANIGIVTGQISGLAVIDIDPRHGGTDEAFKDITTPRVKTGGGGTHIYFSYEEGLKNAVGIRPGIDLRGSGGYVVAPPSINTDGNTYEWINGPDMPLALFPSFVKEWLASSSGQGNKTEEIINGVPEGNRNNSAASMAGKLLARFPESEWESEAWPLLQGWNSKNNPPLTEEELRAVFESIKESEMKGQEEESEKNQSVALQLVEEIKKENILFFHNEQKEGFAAIKGDGREIYKIRSRAFKQYIAYYIYKQTGKITSSDVINNILQVLEGQALFDGQCRELAVRVVAQNNAVWYDLGNGRTVYIDKDGWTISEVPPILFRRYSHQSTQVEPKHGGDLKKLLGFINLKHEEEKLLFLIFAVAAFIPGFPHPILVFHGPQGSGKTTPQRLLKLLIDPSVLKTLSAPDGMREFIQLASHHYFVFLDNLSSLPGWLSDSLAKAVTGDGFSKRELFSDDDDIIYNFQRTVALNGINLVIQRADLLERSILLGLERIDKKDRREEQEFWYEFEKYKSFMLGAIFDTVASALRIYPAINLMSRPRMADFARWGCAIAEALGYKKEAFLTAYDNNIAKQNTEAIDASPVATAIVALMEELNEWAGMASDLHRELERIALKTRIDIKSRDWPKDPSALSRKLNLVKTNLAEEGIQITKDETVRPKKFIIKKINENPDNGDIPSGNPESEAKSDLSAIGNNNVNPDTNADNDIQSQNDGMTGLSGLLPENNQNSSSGNVSISTEPCYACNSQRFWKTKFGNIVCAACHPPVLEDDVVEWIEVNQVLKPEGTVDGNF